MTLLKILRGNNKVHADYFVKKYKDKVRVTAIKEGYIYIWDKSSSLWVETADSLMETEVTNFLTKKAEKAIEENAKEEDEMKKVLTKNELEKIHTKITAIKYADAVWKRAKTMLIQKNFFDVLNKNPDLLPIKDGKTINLKTGKVRERTKDDYWGAP
jgi:hypothetical protein